MSVHIDMELIDKGRVIGRPTIRCENWDGAEFDYHEALNMLEPGQWLHIVTQIPDDERKRFNV